MKLFFFNKDIIQALKELYGSIDRSYKIAFFTALSINVMVFLIFIVQQPMHNHGILPRLLYISPYDQFNVGRWFIPVILFFYNNSNLMVLLPLLTIILHVSGGILSVRLWDKNPSAIGLRQIFPTQTTKILFIMA